MAESPIQQFLNYRHRNWIIAGATIVLILMISLPAYERLAQICSDYAAVAEQIDEIGHSVVNLDSLRKRENEIKAVSSRSTETVDDAKALKIREKVVRLIHDNDCRLLNIQLNRSQSAPWAEGDDPLDPRANTSSEETEFHIITTQLSLSAEGSLSSLTQLVDQLSNLHDFAMPTRMHLQQKSEGTLEIEVELSLLNLKRSAT